MSDRPSIAFLPPAAPILSIALAAGLEAIWAPEFLSGTTLRAIGAALLGFTAVITFLAIRKFAAASTHVDPRKPALVIVEGGPYRFTRNPMYLGMVTMVLGTGLAFHLEWAILFAPIVWAALHYGVVLREEAYLLEKFGAPYQHFMARTRRWL